MSDLSQQLALDVHMGRIETALGVFEQACHDVHAANERGDDIEAGRYNATATKALSDLTLAAQAMLSAAVKGG